MNFKFPSPTPEELANYARHAIATLPDSINAQRSALTVLIKLLPPETEGRRVAKQMLAALLLRDRAQLEFTLLQGTSPKPSKPHNHNP